ncbi:hypothetical protein ACXR2W_11330 [Leucobacter sp. HY1908]
MDELPEAIESELDALQLESLGAFAGRGNNPQPEASWFTGGWRGGTGAEEAAGVDEPTTGTFTGYRDGQIYGVFGVCAGAEGTVRVSVAGTGSYLLECTPGGENYRVQPIVEHQTLAGTSLELRVEGEPAGAVWSLGIADQG